jgi:hypothetical protein
LHDVLEQLQRLQFAEDTSSSLTLELNRMKVFFTAANETLKQLYESLEASWTRRKRFRHTTRVAEIVNDLAATADKYSSLVITLIATLGTV